MDKLKNTLDSTGNSAKEQISNVHNTATEKTGGSGSKASGFLSKGKDQADSAVDSAKKSAQSAMGQKSE